MISLACSLLLFHFIDDQLEFLRIAALSFAVPCSFTFLLKEIIGPQIREHNGSKSDPSNCSSTVVRLAPKSISPQSDSLESEVD